MRALKFFVFFGFILSSPVFASEIRLHFLESEFTEFERCTLDLARISLCSECTEIDPSPFVGRAADSPEKAILGLLVGDGYEWTSYTMILKSKSEWDFYHQPGVGHSGLKTPEIEEQMELYFGSELRRVVDIRWCIQRNEHAQDN